MLVYGFKPYKGYDENVTERVVERITSEVEKVIFPARLNGEMFLKKIREANPLAVLGLGQCRRGEKIRIERKAVNSQRESEDEEPERIEENGPEKVFLNMSLEKDDNSWHSYGCGKYVCNYSMYVISTHFPEKKFAFLHIPKDYPVRSAVEFVEDKIKEMKR